ncbi:MAG: LemA family protein [Candidatus Margulisbacteria bacterium]|nr:LemA family protein [Candidatus Margulisiibacteriota bacterium]
MNNKKLWITLGVIALFIIGSISWYIGTYNKLITMDESVNEKWAQVENVMQRRYDLIPNLINTVKGYAKHEKEIFENIAESRAKLAGASSAKDKMQAAQGIEGALSRLLVVVENYPNLKANENFTKLMDELAGSENRLTVERQRYNLSIKGYNIAIRKFPTSIVANQLGYEKKDMFQMEEKAKEAPKVNFN